MFEIAKDPTVKTNINLAEIEKKETPRFQAKKRNRLEALQETAPNVKVPVAAHHVQETKTSALKNESWPPVESEATTTSAEPATPSKDSALTVATAKRHGRKKGNGFLYRGQLQVTNVEMNSPKITEKIIELGA